MIKNRHDLVYRFFLRILYLMYSWTLDIINARQDL
jgi:hypothetical protein